MVDFKIQNYTEHKVRDGDSLAKLAEKAGIHWQELAEFNWGTSDPNEVNRCLHEHVGCWRRTKDGKNFMFTSQDDPGIVYIPAKLPKYSLETDKAYVFQLKRPRLYSLIKLQSIDELGFRVPNAKLLLESLDGNPDITLTTDARGFVKRGKVPAGRYKVSVPGQGPAYFLTGLDASDEDSADGTLTEAVINTKFSVVTVTRVVVGRSGSDDERRARRVDKDLYGRRKRDGEEHAARGEHSAGPTARAMPLCADNLLLAAGWLDPGALGNGKFSDLDETALFKNILPQYLEDRFGQAIDGDWYVMMVLPEEDPANGYRPTGKATLVFVDTGGAIGKKFELHDFYTGAAIGFYTTAQVTGDTFQFMDLETQTYGPSWLGSEADTAASGGNGGNGGDRGNGADEKSPTLPQAAASQPRTDAGDDTLHIKHGVADDHLHLIDDYVTDKDGYVAERNKRAGKVGLMLWVRSASRILHAVLRGGTGRLEEYLPDTEDAVKQHVHARNKLVVEHIAEAYRCYVYSYCEQLKKIAKAVEDEQKDGGSKWTLLAEFERRVRKFGPPLPIYQMPRPVYATDDQYFEILEAYGDTHELDPWSTLVDLLDTFAGEKSQGYPFLRIKPKWSTGEFGKDTLKGIAKKSTRKLVKECLGAVNVGVEFEGNVEVRTGATGMRTVGTLEKKWVVSATLGPEHKKPAAAPKSVAGIPVPALPDPPVVTPVGQKISAWAKKYLPLEIEVKGKIETAEGGEASEGGEGAGKEEQEGLMAFGLVLGPPEEATIKFAKVLEIEGNINGNLKFTLEPWPEAPLMVESEGNPLTGEFAAGFKLSTARFISEAKLEKWKEEIHEKLKSTDYLAQWPQIRAAVAPLQGNVDMFAQNAVDFVASFECEFEVGFVGTRQETILAIVSMAPGFFERHPAADLFDRKMLWNELTLDEQISLGNLQWNSYTWDHKFENRQLVPQAVRKTRAELDATEKVAIVHLGFGTFEGYREAVAHYVGLPREKESEGEGESGTKTNAGIENRSGTGGGAEGGESGTGGGGERGGAP